MDADYFRQIQMPFRKKAEVIRSLLRFILTHANNVARGSEFDEKFIDESPEPKWLKPECASDPWLLENVGRLFWVCCSLGLLKYQYPYPHRGQTYRPTRVARVLAALPQPLFVLYLRLVYAAAVIASPIARFKRIRNVTGVITAGLVWWRHHDLAPVVILYVSIFSAAVSTWIAHFLFSGD